MSSDKMFSWKTATLVLAAVAFSTFYLSSSFSFAPAGESPSASGSALATNQSVQLSGSGFLPALNVLDTSGDCSSSSYDYCNYKVADNEWAHAEAMLQTNEISVVEERNGVKYVESGTGLEYACGEPSPNDGVEHKVYLWTDGVSPDYVWSVVDQGPVPNPDKLGSVEQLSSSSGSVDVDFESPTEFTVSCVGYHVLNEDGAAAVSNFAYGSFAVAPDSDGDGVNDFNDECAETPGVLNGCPDSDGDGVKNSNDAFPNNSQCSKDANGDGVCDSATVDSDGDGVKDSVDVAPNTPGSKSNGAPTLLEKIVQLFVSGWTL